MSQKNYFSKKKVVVTGGAGFIGAHLVRALVKKGAEVTILDDFSRGDKENIKDLLQQVHIFKTDLRDKKKSQKYFNNQDIVFNLAALNTGVDYDLGRTEVMFEDNMLLQMMPISMAKKSGVQQFIQISSASVYSRDAMDNQVPTPESADTSYPEESKLGYALAKKMGEYLANWYNKNTSMKTYSVRFINVFGEGDNYDEKGHFIPVMIRKFIQAKNTLTVFGSGNQKRSFMHVQDAVSALLLIAEKGTAGEVYNVDSNCEKSVREVVELIQPFFQDKKLKIIFDTNKPEGSQRRMLDSSKLRKIGWIPTKDFNEALKKTIDDIKQRIEQ